MRHIWTVICRLYLVDQLSNNPSLVDVLERISFKTDAPLEHRIDIPVQLHIVSLWAKDHSDSATRNIKVRFLSPDAEELFQIEHAIEFDTHSRIRVNGQIGSLPYTGDGTYEFEVCCQVDGEWSLVALIPLELVREDQD